MLGEAREDLHYRALRVCVVEKLEAIRYRWRNSDPLRAMILPKVYGKAGPSSKDFNEEASQTDEVVALCVRGLA